MFSVKDLLDIEKIRQLDKDLENLNVKNFNVSKLAKIEEKKLKEKKKAKYTTKVFIDKQRKEKQLRQTREGRRFLSVIRRIEKKKPVSNRQFKRYLQLGKFLGEEIIYKRADTIKFGRTNSKRKTNGRRVRYDTYINSKEWETRKNKFYRNHTRECVICGGHEHINLHHAFYGNYGFEEDDDLVCFCEHHHLEFHTLIGKTKKDMRQETNNFVSSGGRHI